MKIIFVLINFFLSFSVLSLIAKDELVVVLKVTTSSGIPIPNCKVVIIEPYKVGFTNSKGVVKFNFPRTQKIKANIEKFLFAPLDTTFIIDTSLDVVTFNIVLLEKEFHSKEVVVTATRTEKELLSISIPISTYIFEDFKLVEAKKLDELLLELTDIPLVDDHGRGVQLQGLDPDYTLLLVNGEPMVNRTGGILDISRLSIGNVSRVEIVKGPSSSLYGSNALAGVINLITEEPQNLTEFNFYGKFGSFNSYDIIGELRQQLFEERLSFTLFAHKFKTDGFKLNPNTVGKTVPSLTNYSLQMESFYNITSRSKIRFSLRANIEDEFNNYLAKSDTINSSSNVSDISGYVFYKNTLNEKFNYEFRVYLSTFETKTNDRFWNTNQVYDEYKFRQDLFKTELQTNIFIGPSNYLTIGGGVWREVAKSVRISGEKESNLLFYLYAQDDINLSNKLNIIGSFRIDDHSEYPIEFNPKLSASYKLSDNLVARASVGTGFKAPNFEELYLDWTNPMAGYSVFGRTYVIDGIKKLQEQGQIALLLIAPDSLPILQPEKSLSFDFGMNYSTNKLFVKLNFFRNNVTNLIDFLPVAVKTNGQRLHTYQNVKKIFTQGVEFSLEYQILDYLKANIAYQFLQTGDLDVMRKIEEGKLFKRDALGNDVRVSLKDYGGLFHRPVHSANIRLTYQHNQFGLFSTLRVNLKSKYGFKDVNSNLILDDDSEYAPGYAIFNWNISKELFQIFKISAGVNNIFDKKDTRLLAVYPGRTFFISVNLNYVKQ